MVAALGRHEVENFAASLAAVLLVVAFFHDVGFAFWASNIHVHLVLSIDTAVLSINFAPVNMGDFMVFSGLELAKTISAPSVHAGLNRVSKDCHD